MSNRRSREGYEKQREHTRKILNASEGMNSITHTDSRGRPITSEDDIREGPDGGIDLITTFETKNKQSMSRVKNKFEKKLREQYGN
jgi:hypothetical protein